MADGTVSTVTADPRICEAGGSGVVLPGAYESDWSDGVRAFLYLSFLLWCFQGVGVISDKFMEAIERITAKRIRKLHPETKKYVTVMLWNPTVANLSLMALGSSAPEILLSIIELLGNNWFAGDLGPSTIVGSAAFNLLVILAVCVSSIPDGEVRKIKEMQVYVVTASFSIFAYVWLLFILLVTSPNVVDIWEGVVTFLFFFLLLILAYAADRGMIPGTKPIEMGRKQVIDLSKEELAQRRAELQAQHDGKLNEEQITKLLTVEGETKTYATYRKAAAKQMASGRVQEPPGMARQMTGKFMNPKKVVPMDDEEAVPTASKAVFEWKAMKVAVMENAGHVDLWVTRTGALDQTVSVDYITKDGTAKKDSDYHHVEGTLKFEPNMTEQMITIKIIDDVAYEDDEEFYVDLFNPLAMADQKTAIAALGRTSKTTVVIIDDDLPGIISFEKEQVTVHEPYFSTTDQAPSNSKAEDGKEVFVICRKAGACGKVSCKYTTEDATAMQGVNFEATEGVLEFADGETQKSIEVGIKARGRYDSGIFRIILTEPTGGAKFDAETDGGADSCIQTVQIESNQEAKNEVDRIMSSLQTNWEKSKKGHANWAEQFKNACYPLGGEECEEDEDGNKPTAGAIDWIMHFVSFPWKITFALVPPTDYLGGWVCFASALGMIGAVTALVGDVAALFGCVVGLKDEVTAITIVALGTSLPDTFASKSAAENDPYADASVGNVTGSNSVNVFLGLGLPWMMGAIYWTQGPSAEWITKFGEDTDIDSYYRENGAFVVKAGSLGFSVTVFSCCAIVAIAILQVRRKAFGGELGGPQPAKSASSAGLVLLWLIYISLSSWNAYK